MSNKQWVQDNKQNLQKYKEYLATLLGDIAYTNIDTTDGAISMLEKGKGQMLKALIYELELRKEN